MYDKTCLYLNAIGIVSCAAILSHPLSIFDTPVYNIKKLPLVDSSKYYEPDNGEPGLFALTPLGGLLTTRSDVKLPLISKFSYIILYNNFYPLHPQCPEDVPPLTPGANPLGLTVPVSVE